MSELEIDKFLKAMAPLDKFFILSEGVDDFLIGYVDSNEKVFYLAVDDHELNKELRGYLGHYGAPTLITDEEIDKFAAQLKT